MKRVAWLFAPLLLLGCAAEEAEPVQTPVTTVTPVTSTTLPDPFAGRRDEKAIARRMAEIRDQVADLLQDGWEVYTVDEVRVEHEAETRRMWPGSRQSRFIGVGG